MKQSKMFMCLSNLFPKGLAAARSSSSQWQWDNVKEYVFDYSGEFLTGLSELHAQPFSGLVRV